VGEKIIHERAADACGELTARCFVDDFTPQALAQHAFFSRAGFDWYPWAAVKQLGFTSSEVFQSLADSLPFGSGVISHRGDLDLDAEWQKLVAAQPAGSSSGGDSFYLDYWNGIGFKMSLPLALEATKCAQLCDMKVDYSRYDDRNTTPFATRLGHLFRSGAVGTRIHTSTSENKLLGVVHTSIRWKEEEEEEKGGQQVKKRCTHTLSHEKDITRF